MFHDKRFVETSMPETSSTLQNKAEMLWNILQKYNLFTGTSVCLISVAWPESSIQGEGEGKGERERERETKANVKVKVKVKEGKEGSWKGSW